MGENKNKIKTKTHTFVQSCLSISTSDSQKADKWEALLKPALSNHSLTDEQADTSIHYSLFLMRLCKQFRWHPGRCNPMQLLFQYRGKEFNSPHLRLVICCNMLVVYVLNQALDSEKHPATSAQHEHKRGKTPPPWNIELARRALALLHHFKTDHLPEWQNVYRNEPGVSEYVWWCTRYTDTLQALLRARVQMHEVVANIALMNTKYGKWCLCETKPAADKFRPCENHVFFARQIYQCCLYHREYEEGRKDLREEFELNKDETLRHQLHLSRSLHQKPHRTSVEPWLRAAYTTLADSFGDYSLMDKINTWHCYRWAMESPPITNPTTTTTARWRTETMTDEAIQSRRKRSCRDVEESIAEQHEPEIPVIEKDYVSEIRLDPSLVKM